MKHGRAVDWRSSWEGMVGALRQGRLPARALAVMDSRSLVRCLFLSAAIRFDLIGHLRSDRTADELADLIGVRRPDRLHAWLQVGVELGELRRRGNRYRVAGRRSRALAEGDELLVAHYRSMLEYQVGPYAELGTLLGDEADGGRDDLDRFADDIAQVSLAAAPFVTSMIRRTVAELRPTTVLDAGCGSGVYSKVVVESDPAVTVEGVDLSASVIAAAREDLARSGYGARADLHVGDIREWLADAGGRFDLVMLLNNIYYFDPGRRQELFRQLGAGLSGRGELLVVTMTTPGSIAAAHLDLMLRCQSGTASLPRLSELRSDLAAAGYDTVEELHLVPTEPFVGIRARRRA
jgi:4-hydroxy-2,2'-bipyrrole-5-carbaldehyde O-methyltransferase